LMNGVKRFGNDLRRCASGGQQGVGYGFH
jgi:hypothetical protein